MVGEVTDDALLFRIRQPQFCGHVREEQFFVWIVVDKRRAQHASTTALGADSDIDLPRE
jgi:hypothetical protein